MNDQIHSCSYYCTRPECIRAQRDELRDRLESATVSDAKPVAWMYDFLNPDNRDEVIRNWTAQEPSEIEHAKGFNVRPLYLHPAPAVVRLTNKEIIDLYETSELAGSHFETGTEKAIAVAHAVMKAMEEKAAAKEAGI